MAESVIFIEAKNPYLSAARSLLAAADLTPVSGPKQKHQAWKILHQIAVGGLAKAGAIENVIGSICSEIEETQSRHEGREVVFCMPQASGDTFVRVMAGLGKFSKRAGYFALANTLPDAVGLILRSKEKEARPQATANPTFALDHLVGIDAAGDDLRDDKTGRLDAKKVSELFDVKMTTIAEAAAISKQGLDQNPNSEKAQPVLRNFERIARLRTHPEFRDPAKLRKWFRKPLPLFSNRSAEDLFKAGKLELVATKVDQMLTGDFGG